MDRKWVRMDKGRWQRMAELFDEAVGRPPEEVEPFLRQACGDDQQLERAVGALIAANREAGDFLEDPSVGRSVRRISSSALRILTEPDGD